METKQLRKTTEFEKDVFFMLDEIILTGKINMFGVAPFISIEFGCNRKTSRRLLSLWMKNYKEDNDWKHIEDPELKPIYQQ